MGDGDGPVRLSVPKLHRKAKLLKADAPGAGVKHQVLPDSLGTGPYRVADGRTENAPNGVFFKLPAVDFWRR
jgi:hypothetical protein